MRVYTMPTVRRAVELAVQSDARQAARALGIPYTTLRRWRTQRAPMVRKPKRQRPPRKLHRLSQAILSALQMHGPCRIRDLWLLADASSPASASRAVNRLVQSGHCVRYGTYRPYTYAVTPDA